ncbi:MAG: protocatechuate 3,4-dioxygenase [Planctomycetota bacterium]|nr:protocatechuate 3,4-dioxygenase [Planctomycetota bacterium]
MDRREFVQSAAAVSLFYSTPGLFAEQLQPSAQMGEGPFYPDRLPLDTDNDLLIINDSITPAVGTIAHLQGIIRDSKGQPIRNAFVEIWQVDSQGAYIHSGSSNKAKADANFQGYGRFVTSSTGEYYFRTIKPVPYPGRTPHIHIGVSVNGKRIFTSQILEKGNPANNSDGLFRQVPSAKMRETFLAEYKPIKNSKLGEQSANFNVILGHTVEEGPDGKIKGGIGKPLVRRRG